MRIKLKPIKFKQLSLLAVLLIPCLLSCKNSNDENTSNNINSLSKTVSNPITFINTDITGSAIGTAPWQLVNKDKKNITLNDFKGQLSIVLFGFTHCKDVCPTTLMNYHNTLKTLKEQGVNTDNIRVLFITLDPERDTFPALQTFVSAFNPAFMALRGDEHAAQAIGKTFNLFFQKTDIKDKETNQKNKHSQPNHHNTAYDIDHTSASYVFDKEGRPRLFIRHNAPIDSVVKDLKVLLNYPQLIEINK